jgi:hypothetical protein
MIWTDITASSRAPYNRSREQSAIASPGPLHRPTDLASHYRHVGLAEDLGNVQLGLCDGNKSDRLVAWSLG